MFKKRSVRITAIVLAAVLLLSIVASAALNYDLNGDGKTNIWDLQLALNDGASKEDQDAALKEALGAGDELHKNAEGQWEIWTSLGLYNMAKNAQAGDTFVLMQDIDMAGALWTPIENFNGNLIASEKYTVSNMKIAQSVNGNLGFFASIAEGGNVYRLNLADMNVIADKNTTSIGLVAGTCAGTVDACTAIGFVTDDRAQLPEDLKVGGLVGTLVSNGEVKIHVENMLHKEGEGAGEIPNISAKLAVRVPEANMDTYNSLMKIVGDQGNGTVDSMASLENLNGIMPDPNAIAWVEHEGSYTYPLNLTELLAAIDADGNSVVTLQADLSNNAAINIPYTSTWDLNGYAVRTNPKTGNCMNFAKAGTDNKVTTVKNGSIYHYEMGIRVDYGAVVVSNVKLYGVHAPNVGVYDPSDAYNDIHLIEDCELYNGTWGVFAYNRATSDFSKVNMTIQRTKLVTYVAKGSELFVHRSGSTPGNVTLGYDVEMYSYGTKLSSGTTISGVDPVMLEDTADVTVNGITYKGLTHWTTNEAVIATEVIAEITNGSEVIQVTNTNDLIKSVKADGNTKIKLLKDITCTAQLKLPYTCTVDLNNFSITNNSGNAICIADVGTSNTVTYIKNGTLNHGILGVRVDKGSIDLNNVRINGIGNSGASVAFYCPDAIYRANNKIDNCYFYNPYSQCIKWNVKDVDFSNSGVLVSNSTLIAEKSYAFGMITDRMSGVNELGENLEIYSAKTVLSNGSMPRFSGLMASRTDKTSVTVDGKAISGMRHWSTAVENDAVNVLLLGNSLSTTTPEELYKIAEGDGYNVNVTDLYHAGACGWQHKEWIQNAAPEYEYRVYNDMGFWLHGDIKTVNEAVDYLDWDHVSYQEWFQKNKGDSSYGILKDFTMEEACKLFESYNDWIYDYLKTNIPNAKFYCFQHWSWQVGHGHVKDTATQTKMYEMIQQTTEYFCDKYDVIMIPSGLAFQYARQDSRIGDVLCKTPNDHVHDNGPTGGQYLNGCVFYEVMFQRTCIGDMWRGSNAPADNETHEILQQHAHNAVAYYFGENYAK